jgi:hypothetical protein
MAAWAPGGGEGVGALGRGQAGGGRTCARVGRGAPSLGYGMLPAGTRWPRVVALGTPPLRRCPEI